MNTHVWGLAALIALVVAGGAYILGTLCLSGAGAAWIMGTVVFACGGWWATGLLLAFFIPSSGLSRVGRTHKAALNAEYAKGDARDWAQVAANGLLAMLALLANCLGWLPACRAYPLLVGALAAATADTWATEVGGLTSHPRLIISGKVVPPGTSGAISPVGLLASLAGGVWIGGTAVVLARILGRPPCISSSLLWVNGIAGVVASLVDSLLGATVQRTYWCPVCRKETERRVHRCGHPTQPLRGWSWMTNDVVNFIATLIGAIIGLTI